MLRAALLALTAPVALAVDPVDELTMAIRNGSPREALEKTQVWLRSHSANAKQGADAQRISRGRFARWVLWRPR